MINEEANMNELVPTNIQLPVSENKFLLSTLSRTDSKTLLIFGGMLCLTLITCVACVSFSESEMTLSKNGLSITQPHVAS